MSDLHMNIIYKENALTAEAFIRFQEKMGWHPDPKTQVARSIANQIYSITAETGGELVGMGRLLGDAAMYWYINDVFIRTDYQRMGIGTEIVKRLIRYVRENSIPGTSVSLCLMSAGGKEPFYERLGFRSRPCEGDGAGMDMEIEIEIV